MVKRKISVGTASKKKGLILGPGKIVESRAIPIVELRAMPIVEPSYSNCRGIFPNSANRRIQGMPIVEAFSRPQQIVEWPKWLI